MLNSALGVTLPMPQAPPISTIRSIRSCSSGWIASSRAMLVSGAVGISVSGLLAQLLRQQLDGVDRLCGSRLGSGQIGAVEPGRAVDLVRRAGGVQQRALGARGDRDVGAAGDVEHLHARSSSPSRWLALPATVVTATSSSSGLARASRRAMASSWPGSQSMITGVGMAQHVGGPRVQTLSCRSPPSFSAPPSPQAAPVATTGDEESVTTGSAVVNGTVDPNGEATRYWVEYGTTSAYGVKSVRAGHGDGQRPGRRQGPADRASPAARPTTTASWPRTPPARARASIVSCGPPRPPPHRRSEPLDDRA